ncbi:MAG TPA: hypothetical protein ENI76_04895 [Ignavibacteria bacterium]|nr:hypothetical protein [Ignavibacteria bacterium]
MHIFLDPARFGHISGFIGGGSAEPYHYYFDAVFIKYAFFYYFVRGLLRKRLFDYYLMLPFLFFLIFIDGGRSMLLALSLVIGITVLHNMTVLRIIVWVPISIIICSFILVTIYYFQGEYIYNLQNKFTVAISVVVTGKKVGDASANARIDETEMVLPYIKKNFILGNGDLSHKWQGGYLGKIGYFAPSDIGFIGNLYVFGVLGMFIFLYQFVFAWRWSKQIPKKQHNILFETSKIFILYFFIHSIFTGGFIHTAYKSIMILSIIYLVNREIMMFDNNKSTTVIKGVS